MLFSYRRHILLDGILDVQKKEWVFADCTNCKNKIDWTDVAAWRSLPELYKEG